MIGVGRMSQSAHRRENEMMEFIREMVDDIDLDVPADIHAESKSVARRKLLAERLQQDVYQINIFPRYSQRKAVNSGFVVGLLSAIIEYTDWHELANRILNDIEEEEYNASYEDSGISKLSYLRREL